MIRGPTLCPRCFDKEAQGEVEGGRRRGREVHSCHYHGGPAEEREGDGKERSGETAEGNSESLSEYQPSGEDHGLRTGKWEGRKREREREREAAQLVQALIYNSPCYIPKQNIV